MVFKLILLIILLLLLNRLLGNFIYMFKGGGTTQPRGTNPNPNKRQGSTYVKSKPEPINKRKDKDDGEYIDYEEIK